MTTEERIAATAEKLHELFEDRSVSWTDETETVREDYVLWATVTLRAAFPEMLDGTAWLAPMRPSDEMAEAFAESDAEAFWAACLANRRSYREAAERTEPGETRDRLAAASKRDAASFSQTFPAAYAAMRQAHLTPPPSSSPSSSAAKGTPAG